jgi:hypothetical protein
MTTFIRVRTLFIKGKLVAIFEVFRGFLNLEMLQHRDYLKDLIRISSDYLRQV